MAPSQTRSSSWVPLGTYPSLCIFGFSQEVREPLPISQRGMLRPEPHCELPPHTHTHHSLATQRAPHLNIRGGYVLRAALNRPHSLDHLNPGPQTPPPRGCQSIQILPGHHEEGTQALRGKECPQPEFLPRQLLVPAGSPWPNLSITQHKRHSLSLPG